jgi:hypothetical protein
MPLDPREAGTIDEHCSLRQIGDVVSLFWPAEVAPNAKVKDEVLNREKKVSVTGFDFRPCLVCGTSPPAQGRLHADQDVMGGTFWFSYGEKHVAVGLRESLHPYFKPSVRSMEVCVYPHGSGRLTIK